MYFININDTKYKCKDNLSEFSLDSSRFLFELLEDFHNSKDKEIKQEIVAYVSQVPIPLILSMEEQYLDLIISKLNITQIDLSYAFRIKGKLYKMIDLDNMDVETFGMLEFWKLNSKNIHDDMHQLINILFREVITHRHKIYYKNIWNRFLYKNIVPLKLKIWTFTDQEPENSELFKQTLDGALAFSIMNTYNEWETKLKKRYKTLWPERVIDDEEGIEEYKPSALERFGMYGQIASISSSLDERNSWRTKPLTELLKYLVFLMIKYKDDEMKQQKNSK